MLILICIDIVVIVSFLIGEEIFVGRLGEEMIFNISVLSWYVLV